MNTATILLTRSDVVHLLTQKECIEAVEKAFRLLGEGKTTPPGILGIHALDGGFHIKAGIMDLERSYFVAKMNANFPANPKRHHLPTIQGVIMVADASNGRLLALTDSLEITIQRTGAATAVAAKYLARRNSKSLAIVGCGNQGRVSVEMLMSLFSLNQISLYDIDNNNAVKLADEMRKKFSIEIKVLDKIEDAVSNKDIVVTCTSSRKPLLTNQMISSGAFIAAVGADNEDKQELDEELVTLSKLVTDITSQGEKIGELHHAIHQGRITREHVHAELGEVIAGHKPGRQSDQEIIVFDSTGMALQDVATAAIVYERALVQEKGMTLDFLH